MAEKQADVSVDVFIANHGSVWLVHMLTPKAEKWVQEHVEGEPLMWGKNALVVEPRYITNLMMGMARDGLGVS